MQLDQLPNAKDNVPFSIQESEGRFWWSESTLVRLLSFLRFRLLFLSLEELEGWTQMERDGYII